MMRSGTQFPMVLPANSPPSGGCLAPKKFFSTPPRILKKILGGGETPPHPPIKKTLFLFYEFVFYIFKIKLNRNARPLRRTCRSRLRRRMPLSPPLMLSARHERHDVPCTTSRHVFQRDTQCGIHHHTTPLLDTQPRERLHPKGNYRPHKAADPATSALVPKKRASEPNFFFITKYRFILAQQ